ncbi:MAG: hypothetical protein IPN76_26515 [Saprospiraceae bacterium]|nr:hypothetical protein [Saprospiraceae bacterium]
MDARIFKHCWYWQERYATQDSPWWGNTYAVGLEPWTNRWRPNPQDSIAAGEWLRIAAGEVITTKLEASGFERTYG